MKRFISLISNFCIFVCFALFILILIGTIIELQEHIINFEQANEYLQSLMDRPEITTPQTITNAKYLTELYHGRVIRYSVYTALMILGSAASLFIFVYCNPRLFRLSTWTNLSDEWAKNRAERQARKQAKTEEEKQKQIAELEKKLDDLKRE